MPPPAPGNTPLSGTRVQSPAAVCSVHCVSAGKYRATIHRRNSHIIITMYVHVVECSVYSVECHGFESHLRQLIFLRISDYLGCAVLLCLVDCLTLLASVFLPSHLSLKHVSMVIYTHVYKVRIIH